MAPTIAGSLARQVARDSLINAYFLNPDWGMTSATRQKWKIVTVQRNGEYWFVVQSLQTDFFVVPTKNTIECAEQVCAALNRIYSGV